MVLYGLDLLFEEGLGDEGDVLIAGVIEGEVEFRPVLEHLLLFILDLEFLCGLVGDGHEDLEVLLEFVEQLNSTEG